MKKLIILLSILFMVSCATTQQAANDSYSTVTVENIENSCQVVENWNVSVLGLRAKVVRFDNCMDLKMLLAVVTPKEVPTTEEIRVSSMNLLSMHYVEYLKRIDESENEKIWYIEKIKEETTNDITAFIFIIRHELKKGE